MGAITALLASVVYSSSESSQVPQPSEVSEPTNGPKKDLIDKKLGLTIAALGGAGIVAGRLVDLPVGQAGDGVDGSGLLAGDVISIIGGFVLFIGLVIAFSPYLSC